MQLNFTTVLDLLFPPTSDEKLLSGATRMSFNKKLRIHFASENITALSSFKDPQIRAALHLVKFHHHAHATQLLASLLLQYLQTLPKQEYILIPIPLSAKRLRNRGHNQVETIASAAIASYPHVRLCTNALIKRNDTPPQSSLSREKRHRNLIHAFACTQHAATLEGKHLILLDDVTTTGSTLLEAQKELAQANPASILCVAIAH